MCLAVLLTRLVIVRIVIILIDASLFLWDSFYSLYESLYNSFTVHAGQEDPCACHRPYPEDKCPSDKYFFFKEIGWWALSILLDLGHREALKAGEALIEWIFGDGKS